MRQLGATGSSFVNPYVKGTVRRSSLGGGVGERPRLSVGSTVGGRWGACRRFALDSRFSSESSRLNEVAKNDGES